MNAVAAYEDRVGEQLAVGLGWFSLALGVAELAAPRTVARLIGMPPDAATIAVLRSYGAREIGNGAAILAQPDRAQWMWSRVAGDALDLATLAGALNASNTARGRALFAAAAVLGVTALDVLCAQQLRREEDAGNRYSDRRAALSSRRTPSRAAHVHEAVTINAPMARVQERWNNLESLPSSLRNLGTLHSNASGSTRVEFRGAPGGRGTEVHVECDYEPTGGTLGGVIAQMFSQDPASQIRHDLRRFKQLIETGEITLSDGPALWRPAQPPADPQDARQAAGLEV
jgi:hypothetical protein